MPRCNTSPPVTMRRRPGSPLFLVLAATLLAPALLPTRAAAQAPSGGTMDSGLPGLHPHWLYAFEPVIGGMNPPAGAIASLYEPGPELSASLARVQALGGVVHTAPERGPGGQWVAGCEDPQGAVFALLGRR